jgi:hypothetical protein
LGPTTSIIWSRLEDEQSRLLELDAALGDGALHGPFLGEELAEDATALGAVAERGEGSLSGADGPHAMVNAPGAEARLRDLEAATRPEKHAGTRHTHLAEGDLRVPVRRVVVPKDG